VELSWKLNSLDTFIIYYFGNSIKLIQILTQFCLVYVKSSTGSAGEWWRSQSQNTARNYLISPPFESSKRQMMGYLKLITTLFDKALTDWTDFVPLKWLNAGSSPS
jgi:hypothetical protein